MINLLLQDQMNCSRQNTWEQILPQSCTLTLMGVTTSILILLQTYTSPAE